MSKPRRPHFIKEWRAFRDLSQEQVAEAADMTAGNLSLLERGLSNYTQDSLERLAAALDCDPIDLLSRDPRDGDSLALVLKDATPAQRRQIVEIAKTILKTTADH